MLEAARDTGLSRDSGAHLRIDLSTVFRRLVVEGSIDSNPVASVPLPKGFKIDKRQRVMLDDYEFARFMASHAVPERLHLMALVSRCFGGLRTSDLHAWDWSHVDTLELALGRGVPSEDGRRRRRPSEGPVFPVATGKRAGERQGKRSHVRELRAALWRANVHRPLGGFTEAVERLVAAATALAKAERSKRREARRAFREAEAEAKRLDAVQTDTPKSRAVDFHSFRRAFNTALAAVGLNVQQAMALAGHRDARTHMRYVDLVQRGKPLRAPAAAMPRLAARRGSSDILAVRSARRDRATGGDPSENRTRVTGVRDAPGRQDRSEPVEMTQDGVPALDPSGPVQTAICRNSVLKPKTRAEAADRALAAYLRVLADGIALVAIGQA